MFRSGGLSAAQAQVVVRPIQQAASPASGATVVVQEALTDVDLWLTPAGPIAALTITLPVGYQGQRVTIGTNQPITALTVNGATSIYNALNVLSVGDAFEMVKFGTSTWARPS